MFEQLTCNWNIISATISNKPVNGLDNVVVGVEVVCTAQGKLLGVVEEGLDPYTTYGESVGQRLTLEAPEEQNFVDINSLTNEIILDWVFAVIDKEQVEQFATESLINKWKFLFEEPETRIANFNSYEE